MLCIMLRRVISDGRNKIKLKFTSTFSYELTEEEMKSIAQKIADEFDEFIINEILNGLKNNESVLF